MPPPASASPASIRLDRVTKRFPGGVVAVAGVELTVEPGEFFSLLGPSGCGKTTTLRMIAGFEEPDEGRIVIGGRDLTHVPVHHRDMGMVFQSYALFPHRTVAENVAFGLRMRKVAKHEANARVAAALAQVKLEGYEERRPAELSGGQQQRVALARAIVIRPPVLLCDEPLGALDRKLRQAMQVELKELQRALGVTLVFVTHDQEEALAMSDRIGVMNAGRLEQVGAPAEIYDRPRTRFVAEFIGEINLIEGTISGGRFAAADGRGLPAPPAGDGPAALALRPEKLRIVAPGDGVIDGVVSDASFLGDQVLYTVMLGDGRRLLVKEGNPGTGALRQNGSTVGLQWEPRDAAILRDS
ncbi:MAG TPA: ABC transporter ATP-binding protein [Beijerinckiaceae bacterium]|nr:ABC transporter ATP-binding protein [Beijerinckiaceae bacterium]